MTSSLKQPELELHVDGEKIDLDTFTFAEMDEYRRLVRESAEDPDIHPDLAAPQDKWPAMVTVIKRRTDPDYTLEQAKQLKRSDILREVKRPTRRGTTKAS